MLEVAKVAQMKIKRSRGWKSFKKENFKIELAIKYIHLESSPYYLSAQ